MDNENIVKIVYPAPPPPIVLPKSSNKSQNCNDDYTEEIDEGVVASDFLKDKDYRFKDLYYRGYCRPQPLKERVCPSRVLKLWKLIYPDYEVVKLGNYKDYRRYPFYVEYKVVEKATKKVIIPKATINALLEGIRDEYYDYENY